MKKPREAKRMGDAAVKERTGKVWAEWFKILDKAGAKKWPHKEIAHYLYEKQKLPGWWSQMVSVGYEHERGIRQQFQNYAGDFSANSCRTIEVPVTKVFKAWTDEKLRRRWLPGAKIEISSATPGKYVRAKWNGGTRLAVGFYGSTAKKTRVAVDHTKLANSKASLKMKIYWSKALTRLEKFLAN